MLKSAIYGFAIGDAVGVPYEFCLRGTFKCKGMRGKGTWNQLAGTYSDDTAMVFATMDSIQAKRGKINLDDLMRRFILWKEFALYSCRGEVFDIGGTTLRAIMNYELNRDVATCGENTLYSNGNGSLMRMLPLAFIDCSDEEIVQVSALTHAHKISTDICVEYVRLTKRLIETRDIKSSLGQQEYSSLLACPEDLIKSTGYVVDTFDAAKWCLAHSKSYKDCIFKAVNLGGDTDTVAAIVGGWAGIVYGYKNIPLAWRLRLGNKRAINSYIREMRKWILKS